MAVKTKRLKIMLSSDYFTGGYQSYSQKEGEVLFGRKINENYRVQADPNRKSMTWHVDHRFVTVLNKPTIILVV